MNKSYKKQRNIIMWAALGQLLLALVIMIVGVLNRRITNFQSNLLMGGSLLIYWILMDVAEPFLTHRLDDITPERKQAYWKYIIWDFVGYAGIAYFLLGMGSNQSESILGAAAYVFAMRPKKQNQDIFFGKVKPEEEIKIEEESENPGETEEKEEE